MQFHLDGFRTGDPELFPPAPGHEHPRGPVDEVDVLIVGSGPAGVVLAAQLSQFQEIITRVVERREGPLQMGQADGVACRTIEMLEAFGLGRRLLEESYWVNETVFWRPDPGCPSDIVRGGRVQDVEDGLSEFSHVIVNQARLQHHLLEFARKSPTRLEPDYGLELVDLRVDGGDDHPVTATLRDPQGRETQVRARYAVGCDGARSAVRRSLGHELRGDATNTAWGVMDVLATTDFPDYRLKSVISSESGRSILLIPREGGYLVRFYVELDHRDTGRYASVREVTSEDLVVAVNRALHPYSIDVKQFAWWSVYEVGQRLTDRFDDLATDAPAHAAPRVFIAGDACHTHSAKAGQGMNVSLQDGFNLGWKLAAVLRGHSAPKLLRTYSEERQEVAQALIDFDKEWNQVLDTDPVQFQALFTQQGRFTAGVATRYPPSTLLTGPGTHQDLATGFPIGMRFHSAPVVRVADARRMELGHAARADGRWRLYAFADDADPTDDASKATALCRHLADSSDSPVWRFTPAGDDVDSVFDVRVIFQQGHRDLPFERLPALLRPVKGPLGLTDYEKAFSPDLKPPDADIFGLRGIDRGAGALVVVRPDQYVAHVLPLDAYDELGAYFGAVLLEQP